MSARISSSQTNLAPAFSAASTMSSRLALAMNARDETIVRTIAVRMAAVDVGRPGRVVDHRRDAAARQQADQRHGDAVGVGQQQADRLARRAQRLEALAEDAGAGQQLAIGEGAADGVFDDDAARAEGRCGLAHRLEQAVAGQPGRDPRLGQPVEQRVGGRRAAALGAFGELGRASSARAPRSTGAETSGAAPSAAGVLENGRWRAPPITIGTILASALLAIWATAR